MTGFSDGELGELRSNGVCRAHDSTSAIELSQRLAREIARDAGIRDRHRRYPHEEFRVLAISGLLGILVPRRYGGIGAPHGVAARVVANIAGADASLGQLFVSNANATRYVDDLGDDSQKRYFYSLMLQGARFGNASSELGGRTPHTLATRALRRDGAYFVSGKKFYATGALLADLITVSALDEHDDIILLVVDKASPGLSIDDDWDGFGQRTTASGTLTLDDVKVPFAHVFRPRQRLPSAPRASSVPYLVHAAVDWGIAEAALQALIDYLRTRSRAHESAGADKASNDALVVSAVGRLRVQVSTAETMVMRAGRMIDEVLAFPCKDKAANASIAVSEARVVTTDAALAAAGQIFQLCGASSTRSIHGLDRFWRDARVHTAHDPVHWQVHAIGNFHLNGSLPIY